MIINKIAIPNYEEKSEAIYIIYLLFTEFLLFDSSDAGHSS